MSVLQEEPHQPGQACLHCCQQLPCLREGLEVLLVLPLVPSKQRAVLLTLLPAMQMPVEAHQGVLQLGLLLLLRLQLPQPQSPPLFPAAQLQPHHPCHEALGQQKQGVARCHARLLPWA